MPKSIYSKIFRRHLFEIKFTKLRSCYGFQAPSHSAMLRWYSLFTFMNFIFQGKIVQTPFNIACCKQGHLFHSFHSNLVFRTLIIPVYISRSSHTTSSARKLENNVIFFYHVIDITDTDVNTVIQF